MDCPVVRFSVPAHELLIREEEALRYIGYDKKKITKEDIAMVRDVLPEVRNVIKASGCYGCYPIKVEGNGWIELPYGRVFSKDLSKNLLGCTEIYVLAVTIGIAFDRLLTATRLRSMAKAALLQGVGATAVEALCDWLNEQLRQEAKALGYELKPRYSAGYGDYGLENQKGIFQLLNPSKCVGISLKDNLIMVPEKSVTAVIGRYR